VQSRARREPARHWHCVGRADYITVEAVTHHAGDDSLGAVRHRSFGCPSTDAGSFSAGSAASPEQQQSANSPRTRSAMPSIARRPELLRAEPKPDVNHQRVT
jgi:hypothetical protein